jgi:hypothetical protein
MMKPQTTIRALAWQLHSGALLLEAGRVVLFNDIFLSGPNRPARATVQARADAINQYLTDNGLHFENMDALQKHFRTLEAQS